jgi:hypothetical protein
MKLAQGSEKPSQGSIHSRAICGHKYCWVTGGVSSHRLGQYSGGVDVRQHSMSNGLSRPAALALFGSAAGMALLTASGHGAAQPTRA